MRERSATRTEHLARIRAVEPRDDAEERRLADPRRPEESHHLPRHDPRAHAVNLGEGHAVEDGPPAAANGDPAHSEDDLARAHRSTLEGAVPIPSPPESPQGPFSGPAQFHRTPLPEAPSSRA